MKRAIVLLLIGGTAHAGGVQRPNGISPRGVGMGGAWTAWVDDPTAIWFNPGAMDAAESQVMVGAEYVIGKRSYTPVDASGTEGTPQETTILSPAPTLGALGRFSSDDTPSRFTLGLGAWNTFGGRVSYPKTGMPALDVTQDLCFEINGGVAMHVSDRFSIGGAVRIGLGFFHIESTMNPFNAELSANGVGVGATIGALLRPTEDVRVGVTWRSPMRVSTRGSGTVEGTGNPDVEHAQNWPQQVSLGLGVRVVPALKLAAQIDWSQWSQYDTIEVKFPGIPTLNQAYPAYWDDNFAFRIGGEYHLSKRVAVRSGAYYDTPAVPDRTLERQYSDSHKFGVSLGASFFAGKWRFDAGADTIIPRTRTVEHNADEVMGFTVLTNKAPGDYHGGLTTFELAAARQF